MSSNTPSDDAEEPEAEPVLYIKEKELLYIQVLKQEGLAQEWKSNLGFVKEAGDVGLYLHPPKPAELEARKPMKEEPVAEAFVLPLRGDEARRRVEIKWRGEPVAGLLYAYPPKQGKLITENAEDEAFNSASKYAAWLETENRMLREARKPLTENEAIELCPFTREEFKAGFLTGIRYAEKHHEIGGDDDKQG